MIVPGNILRGGNKGSIYLNDDASIYTPATILSSETNILTFAVWAKFDPSANRTFFATGNQSGSSGFIWIYYSSANNRLIYQIATGTYVSQVTSFSLTDIIKEEWNHYTFVCNYNTSSVSFFINGNLLNTNTISASIFPNRLNRLYIGRYTTTTTTPNTYFSNARIYGRELTENEIKLLYKGVNISNNSLIGSWAMNENQGEIAYDISGNNLHGTILNGIWTPDKPY